MKNAFGQSIDVGDLVGRGARDGNLTSTRVGRVVDIIETVERHYGTDRVIVKAKVQWLAEKWGSGVTSKVPQRPTLIHDARELFLLDPATVDESLWEEES